MEESQSPQSTLQEEPACCIHTVTLTTGTDLKLFSDDLLRKCQIVLAARKKFGMQYLNFKLPLMKNSYNCYHSACYRKFTAVKKWKLDGITEADVQNFFKDNTDSNVDPQSIQPNVQSEITKITRSQRKTNLKNINTGVLNRLCIFCDKKYRVRKDKTKISLIRCTTKNFESSIQKFAKAMNDQALLSKILDTDFVAKEVSYHGVCRSKYQKLYEKKFPTKKKTFQYFWHDTRRIHLKAFDELMCLIDTNILEKHEPYFLVDIYNLYVQYFNEYADNNTDIIKNISFRPDHLKKKLLVFYKDKLCISIFKQKNILHSPTVQPHIAYQICRSKMNTMKRKFADVAFCLRRHILNIKKQPLPQNISLDDIYSGECKVPELLEFFLKNLLAGPRCKRKEYTLKQKVSSIGQDIIFCTTNGQLKPPKHLELGLVLKSITGSKKMINILNKYGHCVSYSVVEELETELTYAATETFSLIPKDVMRIPNLGTSLAFDNFDRFVETLTGKETLHDTVGILYQEKFDAVGQEITESEDTELPIGGPSTELSIKGQRRRRAFLSTSAELEPYYKKPKLDSTLNIDIKNLQNPSQNYKLVKRLDNLWMMSLALLKEGVPMWTGWNSKIIEDILPQQKIWYLPPINYSPTSLSTVVETLNMAQQIRTEINEPYISVSYDLAIAKLAYQIQNAESPTYDNVFIHLGAFHIELSFFKALGKYIEESGGPHILIEALILASGSLNGFINGTNYNRCKRIHPIFATALQILHFRQYLEIAEIDIQNIISDLYSIQDKEFNELTLPIALQNLLDEYETYCHLTEQGQHGATAQFWMTYINHVKLYLEFSRSIRTNDFHLFVTCLPKIANLMFVMNHHNYSRWILKYYNNLINIDSTHPGLKEKLISGGISVRRTNKNFARTPIDLTLEQTINADAANKLTGISNFTNSIGARKRWALSHSMRTTLITHTLESLGISRAEDITNSNRPHTIRKNNAALNNVMHQIENNINPFQNSIVKENLYNISTGKSALKETKEFLLNITTIGENLRNVFITECKTNPKRFEDTIRKQKVSTFATENVCKTKKSDGKISEIKFERDLMGRLLILSIENKIDLRSTLCYPLTPVPLSLCHIDGNMHKTEKSALFRKLEGKVTSNPPDTIDCTLIDGFFLLHQLKEIPQIFGKIAERLLKIVLQHKGNEVHLIFDKFITPSIKDCERDCRANLLSRSVDFLIQGPEQQRPSDFLKALRNDKFKTSFVKFICEIWQKDSFADYFENKTLFVNCEDLCYKFTCKNQKVDRQVDMVMSCRHEEADTRIIYHLSKFHDKKNVVIKASDTDILIIILGNIEKISKELCIWMEVGTMAKNTKRFVDVSSISQTLGSSLCCALPAFHALTGSDYTAAFSRKGKIKPFSILEQDIDTQKVFKTFGANKELSAKQLEQTETFVCKMYGRAKCQDINEARHDIFLENCRPKPKKGPLDSIKKFDGSMLPPCKNELLQKIKRTNQVCAIWNFSTQDSPSFYNPIGHGWSLVEESLKPEWFVIKQMPQTMDELINNETEILKDTEEEADIDLYISSSDEDE